MPTQGASVRGLIDKLVEFLELTTVHAQEMIPYASTYTNVTMDENAEIYATGTTNAQSGCSCHDVYAYTTLRLPNGRMGGDTSSGYGEVAQATASLALSPADEVDGLVEANTSHRAYCPISQQTFVDGITSIAQQLQFRRAYYWCERDNTGSACRLYGGGSRAIFNKCFPDGFCDVLNYNVTRKGPPTLYRLLQVGRFMGFCGVTNSGQYADGCYRYARNRLPTKIQERAVALRSFVQPEPVVLQASTLTNCPLHE